MNIANKLTLSRVLMIPLFIILILFNNISCEVAALAIFIIASVTDFLDGYLARKKNIVTNFGKFMDPLADKLLVLAALCALVYLGRISVWIVFIITLREFVVTGLRLIAADKGVVIAASMWGKVKTFMQIIVISIALLPFEPLNSFLLVGQSTNQWLMWLVALVTVVSGIDYLIKNIKVFEQN